MLTVSYISVRSSKSRAWHYSLAHLLAIGTYETKMNARTDKHSILTILRNNRGTVNSLNSSFRSAYNWKARPRSSRKENFTSEWGLSPPDQFIPNSIHFSDRFLAKTLKEKPYFIFNDRLLKKRRPGFTPPIIFR